MIGKHLRQSLAIVLVFLGMGSAAMGQTCPPPPPSMFPPAPGPFTHTAVANGGWNLAATWGGSVPGNGAIVCIPAGRQVVVTSQEASRLKFVQVRGELRLWIHSSTRLLVDTIYVDSGGLFKIGEVANTVKPGAVAELVFISWDGAPIDRTWDPQELSRGFISHGSVRVYGDPKGHMVALTSDVPKGATSLLLDSAPSNWRVGDTVVLPGSYFRRVPSATSSQDEKLTLTSVSGASIGFTPALAYDHVRPRSDLRLHLANLSRNVVFRSESLGIPLRGHVMLMNGDVDLRHASLVNLGRTEKARPLDDMIVTLTTNSLGQPDYSITPRASASITNRRGRYALHFHLNGTAPGAAPPSKVYNSVVNGTVGWGFVSHSSHVDFQRNVAYDFAGGGFVTEFGDELGNFFDNVAIRGTGDGVYSTNRIVFNNPLRPQPLSDFAFRGDGFWFQGPAVRARNNVAAGCDGAGMIWFTTGAPDVTDRFVDAGGFTHDRYSFFPRGAIGTVYAGFPDLSSNQRFWDHSASNEKVVIADLPILECDGFEGYGNLVGFRLRFNNHPSLAWYGEDPDQAGPGDFDFDEHILGSLTRMRQQVKNLKLWNNELAFRPNYTTATDWTNVVAINRLDYDNQSAYVGAEIDFTIKQTSFTGLTIDGYEVAGRIENCANNARADLAFAGGQTYLDYANFDTWHQANPCNGQAPPTCPVPTGVTVTGQGSSRTLSWTFNPIQKRFLVRYRADGDAQWKLVDTTGTSVNLTGLATGRQYTYQVIAGCKDTGTGKETAPSTYTAAATFNT